MSESTFILFDASSYLRNEDFLGYRWKSMKNIIDIIFTEKSKSNSENNFGLICMKYNSSEIILNLTKEQRWNSTLTDVTLSYGYGNIQIIESIKLAKLALKHKRNIKQKKRIILIISSSIEIEEEKLINISKDLKKNKYSVFYYIYYIYFYKLDIICFGITEKCQTKTFQKLKKMTMNNKTDCNFLHLKNEKNISLYDILLNSNLISASKIEKNVNTEKIDKNVYLNVDPQDDPELFHAIQMSIEMSKKESKENIFNKNLNNKNESLVNKKNIKDSTQKTRTNSLLIIKDNELKYFEKIMKELIENKNIINLKEFWNKINNLDNNRKIKNSYTNNF